jgi:hypothetical protein
MEGEAEGSMVAGAGSMVVAAEADFVVARPMRRLRVTVVRARQARRITAPADSRRGPAATIPGPLATLRAGINAREIPALGHPLSLTGNGIPLAAPVAAADLRVRNRKPALPAAREVFTCLAAIAEQDRLVQSVAFQGRGVKSTRTSPPQEMLFRSRNRFRPFAIPSADRISQPHLVLPAVQRSWAIADLRVA